MELYLSFHVNEHGLTVYDSTLSNPNSLSLCSSFLDTMNHELVNFEDSFGQGTTKLSSEIKKRRKNWWYYSKEYPYKKELIKKKNLFDFIKFVFSLSMYLYLFLLYCLVGGEHMGLHVTLTKKVFSHKIMWAPPHENINTFLSHPAIHAFLFHPKLITFHSHVQSMLWKRYFHPYSITHYWGVGNKSEGWFFFLLWYFF